MARTSSVRSGFFFCGMALEPVENASGRSTKPNSAVAKRVISSAKRLAWRPISGERLEVFENEVAVAGRVHAVGGGRGEVELAGGDGAVESEGGAGDRS